MVRNHKDFPAENVNIYRKVPTNLRMRKVASAKSGAFIHQNISIAFT